MLRNLVSLLAAVATVIPATSHAAPQTMTLTGTATLEIHERIVYGDPYTLETSTVEATFDVTGVTTDGYNAEAVGTATLVGVERSTVVHVFGSMHPPLGSGGEARLGGIDADGNRYCFGIFDYADAPTPRPDQTIAVFRHAGTQAVEYAQATLANGTVNTADDMCAELYYRHAWVLDGDFSIALSD